MSVLGSESLTALLPALLLAQAELKAVAKKATNSHFGSKYATLSDVNEAILPALHAHGLVVIQQTEINDAGHVVLNTILVHAESGQRIGCAYPVMPTKLDPQGLASALTYSRRNALMALVGAAPCDECDDDGSVACIPVKPSKPAAQSRASGKSHLQVPVFSSDPDGDAERLADAIDDAPTIAALVALAEPMRALPADYLPPLRERYAARRDALQAQMRST